MIISEDAFEDTPRPFICHGPFKEIIKSRIEEACKLLKQFCNYRKQTLYECKFQKTFADISKHPTEYLIVGEPLVERNDGVSDECQRTVCNLCVQVRALAPAKLKALLAFVKELIRSFS